MKTINQQMICSKCDPFLLMDASMQRFFTFGIWLVVASAEALSSFRASFFFLECLSIPCLIRLPQRKKNQMNSDQESVEPTHEEPFYL